MAVKIITDSTCDITMEKAEQMGVEIIPMEISFGEDTYTDGVDISHEEFYKKLRKAKELPKTSQITPTHFMEHFQKHVDNGDEIVGIFLASKLSGTYQNAVLAADMIGGEIYIIDSKSATVVIAMQIELAVKMRGQGKGAKEIYDEISALKERMRFIAQVGDLKYLSMGGRLSVTKALVATTMKIFPLGTLYHGEISIMGTVRGEKKALKWLIEYLNNSDIDKEYGLRLGNADCPEKMEKLRHMLQKEGYEVHTGISESIGPTIGTHVGPDLVGIVFVEREEA